MQPEVVECGEDAFVAWVVRCHLQRILLTCIQLFFKVEDFAIGLLKLPLQLRHLLRRHDFAEGAEVRVADEGGGC